MKVEFWATGIEAALSSMDRAIDIYKDQGFRVEYMAITSFNPLCIASYR